MSEADRQELKRLLEMPLSEKNRLSRQAKCEHEEVHVSTFCSDAVFIESRVCLDCFKHWNTRIACT